jgi:hypothetical protein
MRCTDLPEYDIRNANKTSLTCSPASRTVTSPKSTSTSTPGWWDCDTNAFGGPRPASVRISPRRSATYARTIRYVTCVASCSSTSRSKIRFTVCGCFRGASRSARSISSTSVL